MVLQNEAKLLILSIVQISQQEKSDLARDPQQCFFFHLLCCFAFHKEIAKLQRYTAQNCSKIGDLAESATVFAATNKKIYV